MLLPRLLAALLVIAAACAKGDDDASIDALSDDGIDARLGIDADTADGPAAADAPPADAPVPDAAPPDALNLDAGPPCTTAAPVAFTQDSSLPITDNGTVTSPPLAASGLDPFIAQVTLTTDITHTWAGDLEVTLISPAGTRVLLTASNGGSAVDAFAGTLWSDAAAEAASDYAYVVLPAAELVPEGAMGRLFGEDPNGDWALEVADNASGDTGTLTSWSLSIATYPQAPGLVSAPASSTDVIAIDDNTTIADTVAVSGFPLPICQLRLQTQIAHTYGGDLDIALITPGARRLLLSSDNGGADAFLGTVWRDDAGDPVTQHVFAGPAATLTPEGALSGAFGEDANGTWTLEIVDDAGGDTGQLSGWTLTVTGCSCD